MSDDTIAATGFAALTGTGAAAKAQARAEAAQRKWDAQTAEIHDKGFRAFVEDIEKRKLEEMREKILQKLGLTEEDLSAMSPERRGEIEKLIAQEIQERMATTHMVESGDKVDGLPGRRREMDVGMVLPSPGNLQIGAAILQAMEAAETDNAPVTSDRQEESIAG